MAAFPTIHISQWKVKQNIGLWVKMNSINRSKKFTHSLLNRSRKCRPTYQQAVSKLGNGVRVLTFSRFSISYALKKIKTFQLNIILHYQHVCNNMLHRLHPPSFRTLYEFNETKPHLHLHTQVVNEVSRKRQAVHRSQNCIDPPWDPKHKDRSD